MSNPASRTSTSVGKQSDAQKQAAELWTMTAALKGGTMSMRAAREAFLPRHEAETDRDYNVRLSRSFLWNAYARTVEVMVGKAFSKLVEPGEKVPDQLREWCKNIDRQGTDLHAFGATLFEALMDEGVAHVLVDMPNASGVTTLAEERDAGVRPYWVLIRHSSVLGWRSETVNGETRLTQLRVAESVTVPDGDFGDKTSERVRVYNADGGWQLWERQQGPAVARDNANHVLIEEGRVSIGRIALHTAYAKRRGFMVGEPQLLDLAWLNIEHWQSSSDQNHILHVARVPILFGSGFSDPIKVSPNSMIASSDPNAKLSYVEHGGAAIGAGREDLDRLEDRMASLGVDMLVKKKPNPGDATATGRAITEDGENSVLANLARSVKLTLDAALATMAEFVKIADAGEIDMDTQLGFTEASRDDTANLLKANAQGVLSNETLFAELKRREIIDPSLDYHDEQERIESEGPKLADLALDDDGKPIGPAAAGKPADEAGDSGAPSQ